MSGTAHLVQMFDSTVVRAHVFGSRRKRGQNEGSKKDGQSRMPLRTPGNGDGRGAGIKGDRVVTLDRERSAALREKLLAEVGNITSADLRAAWAREALTAKNSLTATDAKLVEDTFERGLSEFPSSETAVQRFL